MISLRKCFYVYDIHVFLYLCANSKTDLVYEFTFRTSENCFDPDTTGKYCTRDTEITALIQRIKDENCPQPPVICPYQEKLDEYCSKMSPDGEGEFLCTRAKDVPTMKARIGNAVYILLTVYILHLCFYI